MDLPLSPPKWPTTPGKKSWIDLKTTVNELRKQFSSLSSMIPVNIQFRPLSDGRTRIYFLSTPPSGWETTLLYTDIPPNDTPSPQQRFETNNFSSTKKYFLN